MTKDNALKIFNFESAQVRIVEKDGLPWFIAADVCEVLGIKNTSDAIKPLDDDEKMTLENSEGHSGKRGGAQMFSVINESGLYALIVRSNKPEAKKFRKWVTSEVLPALRKTGEYVTAAKQKEKADKNDELTMKRLEVMEKNANWRMAKLLLEGIKHFTDVMTPESKTVFIAKYAEYTTGHDMTHALPAATEKWYSATDLGKMFGVTAARIGKLANEHSLKAPEGRSNEYGTWIRSKSAHSSREVMTWMYYEPAQKWFEEYFKQAKTA